VLSPFQPIFLDEALLDGVPNFVQLSNTRSQNVIQLTRLNNHPLVVNSDLIKFVEQAPDTLITLVNGDKIVVRESAQDVLEKVVQFRRSVLQGIMLWWDNRSALPPAVTGNVTTDAHDNIEGHGSPAGGK
jgi:flagellar protein FlbD